MERSGTLAEPSDNSTTPYIKKRPTLLGQPRLLSYVRGDGGNSLFVILENNCIFAIHYLGSV